jgi:hypothetical protein
MMNFNLKKLFPYIFMSTKIKIKITLILFPKLQILGCYNSIPLKMNLVLEIWKTVIKEMKTLSIDLFHLIEKPHPLSVTPVFQHTLIILL